MFNKKEYQRKWRKDRYRKLKKDIKKILGEKCVVCGKKKKYIEFHEIHNKPHNIGGYRTLKYVLEHIEDFVSVCCVCHRAIHHWIRHKDKLEKYVYIG
jgi:predicted HNH restriction endonuclease